MKKLILGAGLLLAAVIGTVSCSVEIYPMNLQIQKAPKVEYAYGKWQDVSVVILYFPGDEKWENAVITAEGGNWTGAIDSWLEILEKTTNLQKRQAAQYNIACGCYLLRQWELANDWIIQCFRECGKSEVPWYVKNLNRMNMEELEVVRAYDKNDEN